MAFPIFSPESQPKWWVKVLERMIRAGIAALGGVIAAKELDLSMYVSPAFAPIVTIILTQLTRLTKNPESGSFLS